MDKTKCGCCGQPFKPGMTWIVRCKGFVSNPRLTCKIGRHLYVCSDCVKLGKVPLRHDGSQELWTPLDREKTSDRLQALAHEHRGNAASLECELQITPMIVNVEMDVSVADGPARKVGIPSQLVPNPDLTPDVEGIWRLLVGARMQPVYISFTVGTGMSHGQAPTTSGVFALAEGRPGLPLYGGLAHFHVGNANHSGKGTTTRVWFTYTAATGIALPRLRFSNILDG